MYCLGLCVVNVLYTDRVLTIITFRTCWNFLISFFCQHKYKCSFPRPSIPFCRNRRKTSFGFKAIVDLSSPVPLASTNYPLWLWLKLHHCVQNILCTEKLFQFSRFEICELTGIFLIEFNGIYRIHRICRILFLVILKMKIVFYKFN